MKIWVMSSEYVPHIIGGLGVVATHLARTMSNNGVDVTVICSSKSKAISVSVHSRSLRVVKVPGRSRKYSMANRTFIALPVLQAAKSATVGKPDLIHVHSTEFAAAALAAGRLFRVPVVYTCHSIASSGRLSTMSRNQTKLIRGATRIVAPSKWQAVEIRRLYPSARGKIVVIPNGVATVSNATRAGSFKLLYAGRLVSSKGIEELIKAVPILSRTRKNVKLTILGSGKAVYEKKLRALANRLKVGRSMRWIKRRAHDRVQGMYASFGAVVVPSKKESFCLVALEAMAHGVPLVSTLSGGLKEFVNSGNAQIIRNVNGVSIASAVESVWKYPLQTKKRLVKARLTAAGYLWPAIARRYRTLFQKL